MSDLPDKLDPKEVADLAEALSKCESNRTSDTARLVAAQLISTNRLISAQVTAHDELVAGQEKSHQEILREQQNLVKWQRWITLATIVMTATSIYYACTSRALFLANVEPVIAVISPDKSLNHGQATFLIRNAGRVPASEIQVWTASVLYSLSSNEAFELGGHRTLPTATIPQLDVGQEYKLNVDLNAELAGLKETQKQHGGGMSYFTIHLFYRHGITAKQNDSQFAFIILNLVDGVELLRSMEDPSVVIRMTRQIMAQNRRSN